MKPIALFDFFRKLQDSGVDLTGCSVKGVRNQGSYRFLRLIGGNVQVRYGIGFKEVGHMTRGIVVTGVSLTAKKSGKRIVGTRSKNESIVIHFAENTGRW